MNKNVKRALIITVIAILIFLIAFFVYDMIQAGKKGEMAQQVVPSVKDSNTGLDNMINTLFNTEKQELIQDENVTQNQAPVVQNTKEIEGTEILNGTASQREDKAIELAKKAWGTDTDTVYFMIMGIDESGKYMVEVKDKANVKLKQYTVDVTTGRCVEK